MNAKQRFSDQEEYYLNHLEKQKQAISNRFSILGRHHYNLNKFIYHEISLLPAHSKVLDAGCGLSLWATDEMRNRYQIYGIDGEPDAIAICKKLYGKDHYFLGDLYDLELPIKGFDAIVMREVI